MILQITLFQSHMFNGWSIGPPQYQWSNGPPQYHNNHDHHHPHHQGMVQAEDNPSISLYTPPVPPPFTPIHPPCTHRQNFVFVLVFAFVFVLVFAPIHPPCTHRQNFVFVLVFAFVCVLVFGPIHPPCKHIQNFVLALVYKVCVLVFAPRHPPHKYYMTTFAQKRTLWDKGDRKISKENVFGLSHFTRGGLERVFAFNDAAVKPFSLWC